MAMQVGPMARAMMLHFELGGRPMPLTAYMDGGGVWTVAAGATGPDITKGTVWSEAQGIARFDADIQRFASYVVPMLQGKPTNPYQFGALVSACYNAGPGSLANSQIIVAHRRGDYVNAAAMWPRWHTCDRNGNVEPGLVVRRAAEARFYAGGSFP